MKTEHKQAIANRLDAALCDLYHNATPHYPSLDTEQAQEQFQSWFEFAASNEIEYISDNLGCTQKEYDRQVKLGFQANERYFWLVSRITEYGKIYQYGRGGRTLAPQQLVSRNGRSETEQDLNAADSIEMIQILEAFNHYVAQWNSKANIKAMWKEEVIETCPGCAEHITEALWQTPLELMCADCASLLSDAA